MAFEYSDGASTLPKLTILDGAVGTLFREKVVGEDSKLGEGFDETWSAGLMLRAGSIEKLVQVHLDYLRAGSRVLTTNTYTTTPETAAILQTPLPTLVDLAVRAAAEAKQKFRTESADEVRIGGSVPPLRVSFRPDLVPEDAVLRAEYSELVEVLASRPEVDILQIETMSLVREAKAAVEACIAAARAHGKKVWLGCTVYAGAKLPSGEPVEELLEEIHALVLREDAARILEAVNFNCAHCAHVEAALEAAHRWRSGSRRRWRFELGAYPNRIANMEEAKAESDPALKNGDTSLYDRFRVDHTNSAVFSKTLVSWMYNYDCRILGTCCLSCPRDIQALSDVYHYLESGRSSEDSTDA